MKPESEKKRAETRERECVLPHFRPLFMPRTKFSEEKVLPLGKQRKKERKLLGMEWKSYMKCERREMQKGRKFNECIKK